MKNKIVTILLVVFLCLSSFFLGFLINVKHKSYDFNNVVSISENTTNKYPFLENSLSSYICELSAELNLDSDLVVAILLVENPEFDENATHKNENGSVDCGLFQLNDRFLWTSFKNDYWFSNLELEPFNWKHNTYIALHHLQFLQKKLKTQDDVILAYNCGITRVMKNNIPNKSKKYLAEVKNNITLLKSEHKE